uniref:Uncharacterized protein n=1 Tax=Cacopsylla melanoneura TaxID=428564 RepID=A0A8D9FIR7_9HEMI
MASFCMSLQITTDTPLSRAHVAEGRKFEPAAKAIEILHAWPNGIGGGGAPKRRHFSGTTTVKFSGTTTQKRESLVVVFHGWKTGLFHVVSSCFREEEGFFFCKSTTNEFILNTLSR